MNDVVPSPVDPSSVLYMLTLVTHVMYGLHTASWLSDVLFSVIAMIINYV